VPRSARTELAGGVHHVTTRGNSGQPVFLDTTDRHVFLRLLAQAIPRFRWQCLTYCLMNNHFHLLVLTVEPTLGAGMHRVNGGYARYFNSRYRRGGRLWGDRFFSSPLRRDAHLLEAMRYIAWNPVNAGICGRPEDWRWSAHRALLGLDRPGVVSVDETLAYFAADGGDARSRYRAFVAAKRDSPRSGKGGQSPFR
jgi:putative transposase